MNYPRLILGALLVAGIVTAFVLDLDRYLTLQAMQAALSDWVRWRSEHPLLAAGGFFLLYTAAVAVSVPGAAALTLLAGALFGLVQGTVLVSFASSIGATLAFLLARYLFRDTVRARFGRRLERIDEGFRRDGAFYLFTLRLVPVFPFFLINLLSGLTAMRVWTFYWVSQVGMLAATVVYINAGTQLAQLDSMSAILSPSLIASFAALGLFPWLARAITRLLRRRHVYARWQRPRRFDRNLVVIGAGAAGLVTAYIAAAVKARVTLVQAGPMGGDCLNYGCVPSKALIRAARAVESVRDAGRFGVEAGSPAIDFPAVMQRVRAVIEQIAPHDSEARYEALGVEVVRGYARLEDPWTVSVALADGGSRRISTRATVLATGAEPFVPPIPGIEASDYVTSDTLWDRLSTLAAPPRRLVVLGGGPIGCELAQALARLGAGATLVEMGPRLLAREDEDVAAVAAEALQASGVQLLTGHRAVACEQRDGERRIRVEGASGTQDIAYDMLLVAVGRAARLEGYGLDSLGIPTGRTIDTNEYLETLLPNIYAAGDVAGPWQFTHTAAHQAWYAAVNALFGRLWRFRVDTRVIPRVTFLDPEIAGVGLTEQAAREQDIPFEITRYGLDDLDRAIAEGADSGFVKVLTEPGRDRILGVTIVGAHAGELLAEFTLAMKHKLGLNAILGTIHPYPTMAEANKYAAGNWKRAHAPARVLGWLARWHRWVLGGKS